MRSTNDGTSKDQRTRDRSSSALPPATQIVLEFGAREVGAHPFFAELRARPLDYWALWLLMSNVRAGISRNFVVWLATTIIRVEDRRVGSLIAKQLDDELGHGDFSEIHATLLDGFVNALSRWNPQTADPSRLLSAGRRMGLEMGSLFTGFHPYDGVGALIVGEMFAEKMDRCVGDEIRRGSSLSAEELKWLTEHEILETRHAGDSTALAALIPNDHATLTATWRGARAQWKLLWQFLDDVHGLARNTSGFREVQTD